MIPGLYPVDVALGCARSSGDAKRAERLACVNDPAARCPPDFLIPTDTRPQRAGCPPVPGRQTRSGHRRPGVGGRFAWARCRLPNTLLRPIRLARLIGEARWAYPAMPRDGELNRSRVSAVIGLDAYGHPGGRMIRCAHGGEAPRVVGTPGAPVWTSVNAAQGAIPAPERRVGRDLYL
jgi:hypothetical protein